MKWKPFGPFPHARALVTFFFFFLFTVQADYSCDKQSGLGERL